VIAGFADGAMAQLPVASIGVVPCIQAIRIRGTWGTWGIRIRRTWTGWENLQKPEKNHRFLALDQIDHGGKPGATFPIHHQPKKNEWNMIKCLDSSPIRPFKGFGLPSWSAQFRFRFKSGAVWLKITINCRNWSVR
jgi:hypothetical protein